MPKLDEATLLARIAAFAAKPTPDGATALAQTGDERTLPALVQAMTDTMEGQDVVRYRQAVREVGTAPVLRRMLAGALADRREFQVYNGQIGSGDHTLGVNLEYVGAGLPYMKGYRFTVRSTQSFTVPEGKAAPIQFTGPPVIPARRP